MAKKWLLIVSLILAMMLVTRSNIAEIAVGRSASNHQDVFLPLISAQPSTPSPPPPPSGEVVARAFINTSYYDFGSHTVFGEVFNNLDVPVYNVELIVTYRNAAGQIVAMDTAVPHLPRIEAHSSSPFLNTLSGDNVPQEITQITVEVERWATQDSSDTRALAILSTNAYLGNSRVMTIVEGEGQNTTGKVMWTSVLVISFRNSAGEIVWADWEYPVSGALQPGQTFSYVYEVAVPELADYAARVQGYGY